MGRKRSAAEGPLGPPAIAGVAARRRAALVLAAMPAEVDGFLDPALADGAVAAGVLQRHPEAFVTVAGDDPDAVATWEAARDDPEGLIRAVAFHAERHGSAYLAAERTLGPERLDGLSPLERAARHVYLRGATDGERDGTGDGAVAFDAANLRRLSAVLRERDVAFVVRTPFEVLRDVREDDLVLLDPDFGRDARTEREMRSFAGSATARGALVIAPSPRGVQADLYGSWPGFARVGAHPETDAVWGNGPLVRRLRADAP